MIKPELYMRLNNPQVVRGYANMLRNEEEKIAKELMQNLREQASDHARFASLEEIYVERFGKV